MNLSRKNKLEMREIIKEQLKHPCHISFSDYAAYGSTFSQDEEGYSRTHMSVEPAEDGCYEVIIRTDCRDCDGKFSKDNHCLVRKVKNRKRWYWNKDIKTNRPIGKFNIHRRFQIVKYICSSYRDYNAEACGY